LRTETAQNDWKSSLKYLVISNMALCNKGECRLRESRGLSDTVSLPMTMALFHSWKVSVSKPKGDHKHTIKTDGENNVEGRSLGNIYKYL